MKQTDQSIFPFLRYKHLMFKSLYKLKNLEGWKGVYINDDQQKQAERKELRAIFSFAKSQGIDCQLRGQRLIIDSKPYTYSDTKTLPHNLSIEAAKGLVINYGEGGGYKMGKSRVRNFLCPPPRDRVKLFSPPLLKSGNFSRPPYNMAKTSSYRVKTTPKLFVPPPSAWLKLFPPPLFIGVKLHVPPPPVL